MKSNDTPLPLISQAAHAALNRGWAPVPIAPGKKQPPFEDWQNFKATEKNIPNYFSENGGIGVLLGEPSNGLVDVDLDCPEAVFLSAWLPATGLVSGRTGRPSSHRWYYVGNAPRTERFQDTRDPLNAKTLIELRGTGGQTVIAPSPHPAGGCYTWETSGEPSKVSLTELQRAVSKVAGGALLARCWPALGVRHDLTLSLAGWMLRQRMKAEAVADFIVAASEAAGAGDETKTRNDVRDTAKKIEAGEPATGGKKASDILGKKVLDTLKKWLIQAGEFSSFRTPEPSGVDGWKGAMVRKKNSTELAAHSVNVMAVLAGDARWKGCLALNEFSQIVEITSRPPYEQDDGNQWLSRPLNETDLTFIAGWLALQYGVLVGAETVAQSVNAVAIRNPFHPVRDYLDSLLWDGKSRCRTWLKDYAGGTSDSGDSYVSEVGWRWLISAVARIYRPGCQADHALILEGKQGIGKTSLARVLGGEWFTDQLPEMKSKDGQMLAGGVWIIELSELGALNKSEVENVKNFLTITSDRYRPPYGRTVARFDRQCVFIGTVNHDAYLKDATGNRRFWPVKCSNEKFNLEGLKEERDQLFAEAVTAFRAGEKWYLKDETEATAEQADRLEDISGLDAVQNFLSGKDSVRLEEVLDAMGIPRDRWNPVTDRRAGGIMKRLGWDRKRVKKNGTLGYRYFPSLETVIPVSPVIPLIPVKAPEVLPVATASHYVEGWMTMKDVLEIPATG